MNPENHHGAMFWEKNGEEIQCQLCPHFCRLKEGQTGFCKVRKNIDGRLYSLNYGMLSSVAIDPIEKKPLYQFNPGSEILSIGSVGCNFACKFCQNYTISKEFELHPVVNVNRFEQVDPDTIINLAKREELDQIAFTYNEPTVFYELVYDTARLAKKEDIKIVLVTNGYINQEPLKLLLPFVDAMNIDVKSYDNRLYEQILHGQMEPVFETIKMAVEARVHVEVTCLIVPKLFEEVNRCDALFGKIRSAAGDVVLHLSRYFPRYNYDEPATDIRLMLELQEVARKHFTNVYLGNV